MSAAESRLAEAQQRLAAEESWLCQQAAQSREVLSREAEAAAQELQDIRQACQQAQDRYPILEQRLAQLTRQVWYRAHI